MSSNILADIRALLVERGAVFREIHHAPTYTSEESAQTRGESVKTGGKALLIKVDDSFSLFVLRAHLRLDSTSIKKRFNAKSVRFATPEELLGKTGLVPGSVPPFGHPILPFNLHADFSIKKQDKIAFNAGSLTDSIILSSQDYIRIANPEFFSFSE